MRLRTAITTAWDWLPIPIIAALVVLKTDWFTRALSFEMWLLFGLILVGNVAWIMFHRGVRYVGQVHEKYPGFRIRR